MGFIALSFDDGKAEDFTVLSLLEKFNVPATFYLVANRLVSPIEAEKHYRTQDIQSVIRRYKDGLCEIGAHGYDHLHMDLMNSHYYEKESRMAKRLLEKHFGPVTSYAFPYGLTSPRFAAWLLAKKLFRSHRLYETPYDYSKDLYFPDGFIKFLSVDMLNKPFLHIAGHSDEFARQPVDHIERFIKTAIDKGYHFVTVNNFTERNKIL